MSDVTRLLSAMERGEEKASAELLPLVYEELRRLAAAKLTKETSGASIHPTVLVHEAYVRLVDCEQPQDWNGRGHFFGAAAEAMRRILIERARRRNTRKRAGVIEHRAVEELPAGSRISTLDLLALDEALTDFETRFPEKARLVKLRYFVGLSMADAAEAMGMSLRTAERTWTYSKAWLLQAMDGPS